MNRREFLKSALATGAAAAFGKVSFETAQEEADQRVDQLLALAGDSTVVINARIQGGELIIDADKTQGTLVAQSVFEEVETELDYRLTFRTIYKPGYRWEDGSGGWVHQHGGVNLLWTYSSSDGHVNLGWHEGRNGCTLNHDKSREARNLVRAELNKIHWGWPLVEASFLVPRWTMVEMGLLPEEAFLEQT